MPIHAPFVDHSLHSEINSAAPNLRIFPRDDPKKRCPVLAGVLRCFAFVNCDERTPVWNQPRLRTFNSWAGISFWSARGGRREVTGEERLTKYEKHKTHRENEDQLGGFFPENEPGQVVAIGGE